MYITCLKVEGVLVPEIWIAFAEASGIPELKKTTRDEPDYDKLMNSEYLFTKLTGKNKGEPLDADSVYSMLKRLSKKTDINSHPHQLRHYFAEERRKEGWDLNDIRFALGHKKVETTIKYLGENNERLIEATDQYYSNNEDLYQIADFL